VVAEAEAVTVIVAVLLLKVPTEQVTPASVLDAVHVKVGVALKLPVGARVSVDVRLDPGLSVKLLGEALSEKSPPGVAKRETLDHAPFVPPDAARACTCQ